MLSWRFFLYQIIFNQSIDPHLLQFIFFLWWDLQLATNLRPHARVSEVAVQHEKLTPRAQKVGGIVARAACRWRHQWKKTKKNETRHLDQC